MSEIVYRNHEFHLSENEVKFEVHEFTRNREMISDACAQTIASQWHSPAFPNSTALSTMGAVTDDMGLSDFVTLREFDAANSDDQEALRALAAYIVARQEGHNR